MTQDFFAIKLFHSEKILRHSEKFPRHSEKKWLHSEKISRHSEIIPRHSEKFSRHSEKIRRHSEKILRHSQKISCHSRMRRFFSEKLFADSKSEEIKTRKDTKRHETMSVFRAVSCLFAAFSLISSGSGAKSTAINPNLFDMIPVFSAMTRRFNKTILILFSLFGGNFAIIEKQFQHFPSFCVKILKLIKQ